MLSSLVYVQLELKQLTSIRKGNNKDTPLVDPNIQI